LQGLDKTLDGRYVCIEVSDTGVGMDESVQKRIFEPFFTTKVMGQGTGLGLSVVYGIVKNHDGFINVESKPESGTSFRLYFPVAQSLEKPATDEITEASYETTERPNGHGTILLVEDEKNMLDLLEKDPGATRVSGLGGSRWGNSAQHLSAQQGSNRCCAARHRSSKSSGSGCPA
jgi:hypothetical protein